MSRRIRHPLWHRMFYQGYEDALAGLPKRNTFLARKVFEYTTNKYDSGYRHGCFVVASRAAEMKGELPDCRYYSWNPITYTLYLSPVSDELAGADYPVLAFERAAEVFRALAAALSPQHAEAPSDGAG